ncbi:metal-dependent hydrolase [Escherichia coli]
MSFIMTAEGHLLFFIACAVFAKNAEATPALAQGDWWHIVPSAILTCLLPDIDHPKSFLGQRLSGYQNRSPALLGIVVLPTVCWRYLRCWQPFTLRFLKPVDSG